jgi:hypothetical protein
MPKILIYQWCSDDSEAILRALPQAMPDYAIDVTDAGYFRLHRRRLASASGECEAKLREMLARQTRLLDQQEKLVCFGTAAFYIAWLETAAALRINPELTRAAQALLPRFDVIYLPLNLQSEAALGKIRTMETGLPILEELLAGAPTELRDIHEFAENLGRADHGI